LKLQNKLVLLTSSIMIGTSAAIGGAAIFSVQNAEMDRVDSQLSSAVKSVANDPTDPLSSALLAADSSEIGLTVALKDYSGSLVVLAESQAQFDKLPSAELITLATKKAISIDQRTATLGENQSSYRLRAVAISPDETVLFATSLTEVIANRDNNLGRLVWFIFGAGGIAVGFAVVLIRRDVRKVSKLIEAATAIADGHPDTEIPRLGGTAEIDELSRALNRMVESLQHAVWVERDTQQAMQNFLGDASHELRTPLTVIKGYVEMLSSKNMTAEQKARAFERVNAEVTRMQGLINDLLMLAELGEAKPVETGMVNLSTLVQAAVDDLKALQPKRKVSASIDENLNIAGSAEYLAQLVANLFGNLRRHTPDDAKVTVSFSTVEATANTPAGIELTVDDGGPGLPAESYSRGISAFQRFDDSRSRESGGSGLGMSIMAGIVRQHGGRIELNQSPLGGLQTVIFMPAARQ
jgi:two-component system, OmpR family, sensor kinase